MISLKEKTKAKLATKGEFIWQPYTAPDVFIFTSAAFGIAVVPPVAFMKKLSHPIGANVATIIKKDNYIPKAPIVI